MLKAFLVFAMGYLLYKLFRANQLLFGKRSRGGKGDEEKPVLGIRDEDIREAEFKDIDKEE